MPRAHPKWGGILLGLLVLFAPFLLSEGERGKEREREKERGPVPFPLSNSDSPWGGARHPLPGYLASPLWPMRPITSPGRFQ